MQKRDFGIWRNRQPHGANPTAFLSGEDLGIPSGDVGIPTQSPGHLIGVMLFKGEGEAMETQGGLLESGDGQIRFLFARFRP